VSLPSGHNSLPSGHVRDGLGSVNQRHVSGHARGGPHICSAQGLQRLRPTHREPLIDRDMIFVKEQPLEKRNVTDVMQLDRGGGHGEPVSGHRRNLTPFGYFKPAPVTPTYSHG